MPPSDMAAGSSSTTSREEPAARRRGSTQRLKRYIHLDSSPGPTKALFCVVSTPSDASWSPRPARRDLRQSRLPRRCAEAGDSWPACGAGFGDAALLLGPRRPGQFGRRPRSWGRPRPGAALHIPPRCGSCACCPFCRSRGTSTSFPCRLATPPRPRPPWAAEAEQPRREQQRRRQLPSPEQQPDTPPALAVSPQIYRTPPTLARRRCRWGRRHRARPLGASQWRYLQGCRARKTWQWQGCPQRRGE
mmetsp:Transcript_123871/g.396601  ORF Transcript_123871/g.396601 Transcript_123871/m.396601 type:complete len:247 (-) Transcript_123871:1383-2123(-)